MFFLKIALLLLFNFNLNAWFWWGPKNNIESKKSYIQRKISNILVLDPGSRSSARVIDGQPEYEIANYFCKMLKILLQDSGWQVILSKKQDNASNIQIASWANTIDAKLFVNINFYQTYNAKPEIDIYYTAYNLTTDFWKSIDAELSFLPCDNIYKKYIKQSQNYATKLIKNLDCSAAIGIPLKSSVGLDCPSLVIDIGIVNKGCLEFVLESLANSINLLTNFDI